MPPRAPNASKTTRLFLTCLFTAAAPALGHCWDHRGHSVIAEIAERHLTASAREAVGRLLATEGKTSMTQVSSWADRMKSIAVPRQPNHTVKLAGDDGPYIPNEHCPRNNCILTAIDADIATLRNPELGDDAKVAALKYLIHFVGDIHQPLHATVLGRDVTTTFEGKNLSLHRVWDSTILSLEKGRPDEVATDVEKTAPRYNTSELLTPVQWALESRAIARDDIIPSLPSYSPGVPVALTKQYLKDNVAVVNGRLNIAGRRLADVLNEIFGS